MALGDGPVRRVLSLRGGRYFRVSVFLTSLLPRTSHTRLPGFTGAPSSSRRREAAGAAGPDSVGGMRMARAWARGAGPRPVVNHARLWTHQRHVDVNRIHNGERSTSSYDVSSQHNHK